MKINRLPIRTKSWRGIIYRSGNNARRKDLRRTGLHRLRPAGLRNNPIHYKTENNGKQ